MKKSTLAVAALLTTLSTAFIVPASYAEDAAAPAATAPATTCAEGDKACLDKEKNAASTEAAPATDSGS